MTAFMEKSIDLTGFGSATLRFWHKIPGIESGYDQARVYCAGSLVWSNSTVITNWTEVVLDLSSFVGTSPTLRFEFYSDYSMTYEGWYLDDILVTAVQPPANDSCVDARTLTDGVLYTMDTTGATSNDGTPGCQVNFGKGVWFKFQSPGDGLVEVSTCGSSFDTVVEVYSDLCNPMYRMPLACNDDSGPSCGGNNASLQFNATANAIYRILAGGYVSACGTLQIVVVPRQRLTIRQNANGTITVEWPFVGTLQAALSVTGSWQDLAGATSPYTFMPTGNAMFLRVRQ